MSKLKIIALALSSMCFSAFATDYYVVVPVKNKIVAASAISVALAPSAMPGAIVGQLYSYDFKQNLQVSGDAAYSGYGAQWTVSEGLPAGLTLNAASGVLSGTPVSSGNSVFTVNATYKTKTGTQTYQIPVSLNLTLALDTATLPLAQIGLAYTYDFKSKLTVTGDPAYASSAVTWSMPSGALPSGLTLTEAGVLSGTVQDLSKTGTSFAVAAQYKGYQTQQSYTVQPVQDPYAAQVVLYVKGDTDLNDKSSNHFVGAATAGVTRSTSPAIYGSALQFNGSGGYISYGNQASLKPGTGDFTVEFWMNSKTGNDTYRRIITSTTGGFTGNTFILRHGPSGFEHRAGSIAVAIPLNTWTHIAYSRTAYVARIFINGIVQHTWTDTSNYSEAIQYVGGYYSSGEYFSGALDEIKITNGVGRYTANFTVSTKPTPDQ